MKLTKLIVLLLLSLIVCVIHIGFVILVNLHVFLLVLLTGHEILLHVIFLLKSKILIETWNGLLFLNSILIVLVLSIEWLLLKCWATLEAWLKIKFWLSWLITSIILCATLLIFIEIEIWLLILSLEICCFLNELLLRIVISSKRKGISALQILIHMIVALREIFLKTKTHFLALILIHIIILSLKWLHKVWRSLIS